MDDVFVYKSLGKKNVMVGVKDSFSWMDIHALYHDRLYMSSTITL